ncbi:MAG: tetratricopeptide repeat protein [Rhodospirillaceae bacterium]
MTTNAPLDLTSNLKKAANFYYASNFEVAKDLCSQILVLAPGQPDALNILALSMRATKKWGKAEEIARDGLKVSDGNPSLLNTLGLILLDQRRLVEAAEAFRLALQTAPNKVDLRINLALTEHELGEIRAVTAEVNEIIDAGTDIPSPFMLRAAIRIEQGDFDLARIDLDQAEKLGAPLGDVTSRRAQCDLASGNIGSAGKAFDKAVFHAVDVADARVNRGVFRLLQGEIEEGWIDYNMRYQRRWGRTVARPLPYPQWQGESLINKTILLWTEQGLGESILCSTLINDTISEADLVILECNERLVSLFQRSFPNLIVKPQTTPPDSSFRELKVDFQASLLDLVRYHGEEILRQPANKPSIRCDSERTASLRAKYINGGEDRRPLVGLSWSSPKAVGARVKGVAPEKWRSILSVPRIKFVNLQYGDDQTALDEIATTCGATLINDQDIDQGGPLDGLTDQIAALDLVISVSTTTAHIAGALGQETWVIVPPVGPSSMWYWFLDRSDTPWYSATRLFRRQYGKGQDALLMDVVGKELNAWLSASS